MGGDRKRLSRRGVALGIIVCLGILAALGGYYHWQNQPAPGPVLDGQPGYDVIVVGGEPEGVAAALSAARNGLKTLLLEDDAALGGLMTLGELNFLDMNHGPKDELLTRGIFEEFYNDLGNAFDLEEAKQYFLNKVKKEKNITLLLNTKVVEPIMEGNIIKGVVAETSETADADELSEAAEANQATGETGSTGGGKETKEYLGLRVIDATVDADVAAAAGVPYTIGGEDYGEEGLLMGVTLVFEVSGVDWQRVINYLKREDNDPYSGASQVAAWGYGQEAMEYQPQDPQMRFRGPNLARQKNGNVLINALLIFGVDGLDPVSKAEGIARGKKEAPHIVEFMREKFPGFEQAEFVRTAEQLYVRETRHIQGVYRLTITDVLENRDHWDKIGFGSYPVDVQPTSPGNYGNVIGKPDLYAIPFRCLVPFVVDNLLVVGRSASYDSLPHGSARVIPVGMVTGEAAGVACAYSVREDLSFREMAANRAAIEWVQNQLKKQGAYLVDYTPPRPAVMDHWAYPGVRVMRELGLIEGGYANDYGLEREINKWNLENKLNKVLRVAQERNLARKQEEKELKAPQGQQSSELPENQQEKRSENLPENGQDNRPDKQQENLRAEARRVVVPEGVTRQGMLICVAEGLTGQQLPFSEAQELLREKGILTADLEERLGNGEGIPTFAEMLVLLANTYLYLLEL